MPERHCQRENNTALMPANPKVHRWHSGKHLNYPAQIAFVGMHHFFSFFFFLKTSYNQVFFWLNYKKPITSLLLCEGFHGHTLLTSWLKPKPKLTLTVLTIKLTSEILQPCQKWSNPLLCWWNSYSSYSNSSYNMLNVQEHSDVREYMLFTFR